MKQTALHMGHVLCPDLNHWVMHSSPNIWPQGSWMGNWPGVTCSGSTDVAVGDGEILRNAS